MSKKILCPTDGSEHAKIGFDRAIELALQNKARLTVCVVNIAHGGARGPTINHWKEGEVAELLAAAEAAGKAAAIVVEKESDGAFAEWLRFSPRIQQDGTLKVAGLADGRYPIAARCGARRISPRWIVPAAKLVCVWDHRPANE